MQNIKYQVFISSTFSDLRQERLAVSKSVLDMGHIPSGMEMFPAAGDDQLSYIEQVIDECDYYVLIIGGRYGSTDSAGVSYTEREFDYAVQSGKTVLAFVHADVGTIPSANVDLDPIRQAALEKFSDKAKTGRLVKFWNSVGELNSQAIIALTHAFRASPQPGWIRADKVPTDVNLASMAALREQNNQLSSDIAKLRASFPSAPNDAAGFDEPLLLRLTYKIKGSDIRRSTTWSTTYGQAFKAIAKGFAIGHTPVQARKRLSSYYEDATPGHFSTLFNEHDVELLLVQFVVLGLMATSKSAAQDGNWYEFYTLTPAGETLFRAATYARKTPQTKITPPPPSPPPAPSPTTAPNTAP